MSDCTGQSHDFRCAHDVSRYQRCAACDEEREAREREREREEEERVQGMLERGNADG